MEFPDFRDFLASLTADQVSGIMHDAQNAAKLMQETEFIDPADAGRRQGHSMALPALPSKMKMTSQFSLKPCVI